ncbi:hypothetical protein PC129_g16332 [Phytophthora cactorum]|uniref:Tc1-like transposase DDE domain-containing protein n=2 Tax=Phytophthora cactorum TaxID=29920 RepID=A0A8T1BUQ5_9STRA|nr:hypothetical protein Pcac1_g15500 [Phytophthora cactorum]KAG2852634.1 hypothetical protein PC113_g14857 [Phytophthora cactorum]KAG2893860.1 hypothetical protein PC114_g16114 [Phytophthora cactorum]KAG2909231.1 hypothetical protein PC115_g13333 [Phytophthora cactorum]KAG2976807.1 hypothetical protein PC118_g13223 [Phytophthora cactorum]
MARLNWAKNMIIQPDKWSQIVFSDEKKFNLDGPDGLRHYWRDVRRSARQTVRRQNGGGSVMVWGSFSSAGKSKIAVLEGRQASEHYNYTVSEYMLPFAHLHHGVDYIYQQDNASIHRSKLSIEFFEEEGIKLLDWPARLPDLNPIENVWAMMARIFYHNGKQYDSVAEMRAAIIAAWEALDTSYLGKLVDSLPKRCMRSRGTRHTTKHNEAIISSHLTCILYTC